jgi:protein SERAC1
MLADNALSWRASKYKPDHHDLPEYGLHTLVSRDPIAEDVTDIVAVHGLNGHHEKTWKAESEDSSGYNWLKDALNDVMGPNVQMRVMSFSYNAKLKNSKSTADIFDFADQLLECLLLARQEEGERLRPIVFICHSLGGIVFKQVSVPPIRPSVDAHCLVSN